MARPPSFACRVFRGSAVRAVSGVNEGDAIVDVDALCPGDLYRFASDTEAGFLAIVPPEVADMAQPRSPALPVLTRDGLYTAAPDSEAAPPGTALRLAGRATFLAPDGHSIDLALIEARGADEAAQVLLAPLGPVEPGLDYTLAGVAASGPVRLADMVPFAFAAGTRIMMADGTPRAVETLRAGDPVLTRDSGPLPLLAVLPRTERALGPYAPVVIGAEVMGNPGELILSQHQRLLVYQRGEDRLTETAEMLVRAGDLVDGERVFVRRGGFVEYYALVLSEHEMVYAECVAVESLEVNAATLPRLPDGAADAVAGLDHAPHFGTEAGRAVAQAARRRLLGGD